MTIKFDKSVYDFRKGEFTQKGMYSLAEWLSAIECCGETETLYPYPALFGIPKATIDLNRGVGLGHGMVLVQAKCKSCQRIYLFAASDVFRDLPWKG